MTKLRKILLIFLHGPGVVLATAITFTIGWRPFIGPKKRAVTNRQFERTPERLARGSYLVQGLLDCGMCHSARDWSSMELQYLAGWKWPDKCCRYQIFPERSLHPI